MSIATEITRLQNAKSSLKSSLEAKGVTVASDATLDAYPALVDSIPQGGGGGGVEKKDVNFYDYDGTVLYSYTAQEFAALESMPANPDRTSEGLTSQGWNWSLADAKTYVAACGSLDIGQMYAPTDGKTKLYVTIEDNSRPMALYFGASVIGSVTIDWGDGNTQASTGISQTSYTHDYATTGDYVITLAASSGTSITIGGSSSRNLVKPSSNYDYNQTRLRGVVIGSGVPSINNYAFSNCFSLQSVTIPSSVTSIGYEVFSYCYCLQSVTIPSSVTSIGNSAFFYCHCLPSVTIPSSVTSIGYGVFSYCSSLQSITLPSSVISIGDSAFRSCISLQSIIIPSGVTSIDRDAFLYCNSIKYFYCEPTTPPTIQSNSIQNVSDMVIYVPAASVDTYKGATNWLNYASYIQAMPIT